MNLPKDLLCEVCGIPWKNHKNVLVSCKEIQKLTLHIEKISAEYDSLLMEHNKIRKELNELCEITNIV